MLIYALTGQVWTIQLIRAVPTILFCKTEPTKDSGMGERHNTEQNQQHRAKPTTQSNKSQGEGEKTHGEGLTTKKNNK